MPDKDDKRDPDGAGDIQNLVDSKGVDDLMVAPRTFGDRVERLRSTTYESPCAPEKE